MQTERAKQMEYNLAVLRRRDAAISRVLDMAGHVVLYHFDEDSKAWDRKNVEGSLFVVERSAAPTYQFVVLNRLSSENLVETIDENFQTELTEQFLLYRNAGSEILGVWFYSPGERAAINDLLTSLTSGTGVAAVGSAEPDSGVAATPDVSDVSEPSNNVAQLFNMMAGAQQEAPPMPGNAMPASVAQLFSAADSAVAAAADAKMPPPAPPEPQVPTPAPAPVPTAATAPVTGARPPVDMASLKAKLATQLRALVDDDAFLSILATEYLRQQQRAMQQAQQARQAKSG